MEKFKFRVDLNTPYMKAINFIGAASFGFIVGTIFLKLRYEGAIDWLNSATGIMCSLFIAFFPDAVKKQSLTIDETGIYLHNYTFHLGQKSEIKWENVSKIGVKSNVIQVINRVGSIEKIKLPIHTKSQLEELKSYLKQMTEIKNLECTN